MPRTPWIVAALASTIILTSVPAHASPPVDVTPLIHAAKQAQLTSTPVTASAGQWDAEEVEMVVRPAPEPEPEPAPVEVVAPVVPDAPAPENSAPVAVPEEPQEPVAPEVAPSPAPAPAPAPEHAADASVVDIAKAYIGVPYVSGGSSPSGFDCSGFTSYVYAQVGINLPRTSGAQGSVGTPVPADQAQPGDLVWSPGHVAIYVGDGQIIDAPKPGGSVSVRPMWQQSPTFIRL